MAFPRSTRFSVTRAIEKPVKQRRRRTKVAGVSKPRASERLLSMENLQRKVGTRRGGY